MNRKVYHRCFASIALLATVAAAASDTSAADVTITKGDGKATVRIDGELFTDYVFEGHAKPIFYPIIGPAGIEMTRHYPMKKDVDNEASDHPHHKSLWFTHDDVNGVQFWMEYPGADSNLRPGKIVQTEMAIRENTIHARNEWRDPNGEIVCTEDRDLGFGSTSSGRYIDIGVTMHASHGEVKFGDTKEGTMGIRTNPLLRLQADERRGNHTAKGSAINSEGVAGKAIWGKRAKWVDYWAPINGTTVGVAIFDHPSNPRHPTWWHAREYGLIAANPFGVHDFENKPAGTGDMVISAGESATFRYRFLFHQGDVNDANVAGEYAAFAE